jgi:hypothetical protein
MTEKTDIIIQTENNEMWKCVCFRNSLYDYTYLFIYLFIFLVK